MAAEPYIPEEQTGVGPSAKIYRAHEVNENRLVRLKVLLAEHESPYPVDRQHLTERIPQLQTVRGERVCELLALDIQAQDMSVVSAFGEGLNGWAFSQQGHFTSAKLRVLADQMMTALRAGERALLPHGNIKPSNVLIENRPVEGLQLILQDWGIAESRHRQPRETLVFRAPECLHDQPPTLQSDLFSAGATLAAMCTGHALVEGNTAEQFYVAWQEFDAAEWQAQCPHIEPSLLYWLAWLLKFKPEDRPGSVQQALAGLHGEIKLVRPKSRSWFATVMLLFYNIGVIGTLTLYWLWLTKHPFIDRLAQWWQQTGLG